MDHPDRLIDCEISLRAGFERVIAEAIVVGWCDSEVTSAMIGYAADRALSAVKTVGTAAQIVETQMMIAAIGEKKVNH